MPRLCQNRLTIARWLDCSRLSRWPLLPSEATPDAGVLLRARAVRAFGDGFVSVLLPLHLTTLGFDGFQIGAVATATLLGSAALTLLVGLVAYRLGRQLLLLRASLLMIATGLGFAFVHDFWPLLVVAFVGTLNPSSGDVSVFLPTEQALLPQTVSDRQRTALFARYSLVGSLVAAAGALTAGLPELVAEKTGLSLAHALDGMFLLYALLGLVALLLYRGLSPAIEPDTKTAPAPLTTSKGIVYKLAALFSLDSFGSGFVVQSLLALWLFQRFESVGGHGRRHLLLDGGAVGLLRPGRGAHRQPHRTPQHGRLHPPPGEPLPGADPVHADRRAGRGLPAAAQRAVADGRAGAQLLRDGRRLAGRAAGGGQRHRRAQEPRRGPESVALRLAAHPLRLRLAIGDRRERSRGSTTCSSCSCSRRSAHRRKRSILVLALARDPIPGR